MKKLPFDEAVLFDETGATEAPTPNVVNTHLYSQLWGYLNVSAATGTSPTLDIKIQEKVNGEWYDTGYAFAQATGASKERLPMPSIGAIQIRAVATIGGTTPSFDFTLVVTGKAERKH